MIRQISMGLLQNDKSANAKASLNTLLVLLRQLVHSSDRPIILNHRDVLQHTNSATNTRNGMRDEPFLVDECDRKAR